MVKMHIYVLTLWKLMNAHAGIHDLQAISRNEEAYIREFRENLEKFPRYYMQKW